MAYSGQINKVSILGCGWFGLALAKKMIALGFEVRGSTTTADKMPFLLSEKIQAYLVNFTADEITADPTFFDADVLFICIPPKRNAAELHDYPKKISAILAAAKQKSTHIILISSTSVYSDENQTVTENSATRPDTDSGRVVLEAEQIMKDFSPDQYTIIRFAGLIGPDRNPGRFFAGRNDVANGLAPVNLIHQTDAVGISLRILEKQAFGRIYNACAPSHPSKIIFYTAAAKAAGLIEPIFINEKKEWKIIGSINVPQFLDYNFQVII